MRVHYDDQIVRHQPRGGVSRYFVELVRRFKDDRSLGVAVDLDWRGSGNEHAVAAGLDRRETRWGRQLERLAEHLPSRGSARPDVYHPTWYHPEYLPTEPGPPMVVTVVDMIPELHPEHFGNRAQHLAKEAFVRRAAAITCISESTRRDLMQVYGPLDAVVEVVHLGVNSEFRRGVTTARELPNDYLLFLGNRGAYKDFATALAAFAEVRTAYPELSLVAAGGGGFKTDELAEIRRRGLEGAVHRVDVPDGELPAVFGAARAFLFPSRYEGFGLPTLEAMACGTPVVLADSSSLPEVGGDAALYFPPGDPSALGAQVLRILGDTELAQGMVARGLERAAGFTWQRTAERTRDVYATAMRPGRS
jgi:glycosyltransferase involved in cell wall biosynthesis